MKRWIFFDLGGTLIDETMQEESIVNTIVSEFARLGIAYSKLDVFEAMKDASISYESVVKGAVRKLSKTPKQYNDIIQKAVYINELELLYPHVVQVLEQLSKQYNLGVIANQAIGAESRLKKHMIHRFFSVFALSAEVGFSKPDQRIFEYALQQADCQPKDAVMVGDRLDNDIYPANIIGMTTVRVLQGVAKYQNPLNEMYSPSFEISLIGDMENFTY